MIEIGIAREEGGIEEERVGKVKGRSESWRMDSSSPSRQKQQ